MCSSCTGRWFALHSCQNEYSPQVAFRYRQQVKNFFFDPSIVLKLPVLSILFGLIAIKYLYRRDRFNSNILLHLSVFKVCSSVDNFFLWGGGV